MDFKTYFTEAEENQDVTQTLQNLPASHRKLAAGYTIKFQPGNTLKNDKESIGEVDEEKKTITICAPWHYGRQMTLLHEVGHLVWKYIMTDALKEQWKKAYDAVKHKQKQGMEELFCMAYGAAYAKHPPVIHYHKEWIKFIKGLPK